MVTDRTQVDVTYALAHPDSSTELKGAYNYTDLNRVESKVEELATLLTAYNYLTQIITTKTNWTRTDFFNTSNASRYISNLKKIRNCYYVMPTTPTVPGTMQNFDYQRANDIEQFLVDVELEIGGMVESFKYAGEVYAGEDYL